MDEAKPGKYPSRSRKRGGGLHGEKGGGVMMVQPEIVYYARLTYDKGSKKTPKYVITAEAGYYPPMDELRGRDGRVSVYLMAKRENQTKSHLLGIQKTGLGVPWMNKRVCLMGSHRQSHSKPHSQSNLLARLG